MNKKKTILLLSDDMRMSSGISTISKEIILGTVDKFNWIQLGAHRNHPDKGKILDISEDVQNVTGVKDAYVHIVPSEDYGNASILFQLINTYKPDAILHFTDPRFWKWLYDIESEVRKIAPILYYHIWDNLPDPTYNRNYLESCDWIGCISRQTYGIAKRLGNITSNTIKPLEDWQVDYVPHGINSDVFKPVEVPPKFRESVFGKKQYKFVLFWMNRNIKRKQPSDVIWAYSKFVDGLPEEDRDSVCLLMHTTPIDDNGTNLYEVKNKLCPNYNILFSTNILNQAELNFLYNISDVTINIAGNEGFGLTTAESIMAGKPIITNVTGGLQDQCGITRDGIEFTSDDYIEIGSLHTWREWEDKIDNGDWVKIVWPRAQTIIGSVRTPYIIDDKVDTYEVADAIRYWYDKTPKERKRCGTSGREWMLRKDGLNSKHMCKTMSDGINTTIKNWKPKKDYTLYKIT